VGDRTIRSRAVIVVAEPHGIVRVAFDSGDILSLSSRSAFGVIDPPRRRVTRSSRASDS
jgi:hypothetical protein